MKKSNVIPFCYKKEKKRKKKFNYIHKRWLRFKKLGSKKFPMIQSSQIKGLNDLFHFFYHFFFSFHDI